MLKYLLVLSNSLFLLIYGWFVGQNGITVTSTIPDKMNALQEYKVELRVNKGKMVGFAKLQMDMPAGFTIKDAEEKGSNFIFGEGVAKWVWAVLPADEEIVINFTLIAAASLDGRQVINVRYSYVEENEKKQVDMDPANVFVYPPEEVPAAMTHGITETPVETPTVPAEVVPAEEKNSEVSIRRSISPGGSINEFLVTIFINKGKIKGFARYSDDMPRKATANPVKTDGSSFSVADEKVRFVWVSVPDKEELEISYKISCKKKETLLLHGEFSYLEDNQSKKVELNEETITFEEFKEPEKKKEEKPVEAAPEKTTTPVVAVPAKKAEKKSPVRKVTPQPQKIQAGIIYHVQIGAFSKKKMTVDKLSKRFRISETIFSEMHEGFNKFMVGDHIEYRQARDHREILINTNKIKTAFVVAYNNGKRITVQEALMITHQKWFR